MLGFIAENYTCLKREGMQLIEFCESDTYQWTY